MTRTARVIESDYNNFTDTVGNVMGIPPALLFVYNGTLFMVGQRVDTTSSSLHAGKICVYRSTNGGFSFIAHEASLGAGTRFEGAFAREGNTVHAVVQDHLAASPSPLKYFTFNLDTLTYSAAVDGPSVVNSSQSWGITVNGGVVTVVYTNTVSFVLHHFWARIASGVWGAGTDFESASVSGNGMRGVAADSSGNVGIAYAMVSPTRVRFRSLSPSGSLSAPADIAEQSTGSGANGAMIYVPETDSWLLGDSLSPSVRVFEASPAVNPATVTVTTVATPPAGNFYTLPFLFRDGADIIMGYERASTSSPFLADAVYTSRRADSGGSWGSQAVLFDRTSDTFIPPAANPQRDQQQGLLFFNPSVFSFEAWLPGSFRNQYTVVRPSGNVYYANCGSGPYCPVT